MDMDEINKLLGFETTYNNKETVIGLGLPPGLPPPINDNTEDNSYKIYFQFNNDEPAVFMDGLDINSMFTLSMNPKQNLDQGPFLQFRDRNNVFRLMCRKK